MTTLLRASRFEEGLGLAWVQLGAAQPRLGDAPAEGRIVGARAIEDAAPLDLLGVGRRPEVHAVGPAVEPKDPPRVGDHRGALRVDAQQELFRLAGLPLDDGDQTVADRV